MQGEDLVVKQEWKGGGWGGIPGSDQDRPCVL